MNGFKLTHPRRAKGNPETPLVKAILESLYWEKGVTAWRTNSGKVKTAHGSVVQLGPDGCGDISGVIAPWGVHFEVEVKRRGETQREAQEKRQELLRRRGAYYFVARDIHEARRGIAELRETLTNRFGP